MRKEIIMFGLFLVFGFILIFGSANTVQACVNWCEPPVCASGAKLTDGSCTEWVTQCADYGGCGSGYGYQICGSGYYACADGAAHGGYGYCCAMGSGGGGGNTQPKDQVTWSCDIAGGETVTFNQLSAVQCYSWNNVRVSGNAVRQTSPQGNCCPDNDEGDPCHMTMYDFASCCPAGTSEQYFDTVGSNYTYTHSCHDGAGLGHVCQNPTDIWVSDDRDGGSLCYVAENNCVEQKNGDIDCEYTNIYNFSTTCTRVTRSYACVSDCTAVSPAGPNLSSPANGANVATTTVNLTWNATSTWGTACPQPNVNEYKVYVGTTNPPTTLYSTESSATLQKSFVGTNGTTYYWYVAASNGSAMVSSAVRSFTIQSTIGGRVYNVEDNVCPGGVGSNFGGLNVAIGATNAPVAADGTYSAVVAAGSYNVSVGIPTGYSCANGTGCGAYPCSKTGVAPGTTGLNFYLSSNKVMWWQAEGAGVYAGSSAGATTIRSTIPASILTNRYLVLANTGGTAAAVLRASGTAPTATSGTMGVGTVNADGWSAKTTYKGKRADYSYFKNQMGLTTTTPSLLNLDSKPSDGATFHYINSAASVNNAWAVGVTESLVIFVNGDLDINADIIVTLVDLQRLSSTVVSMYRLT